MAAGLAGMALAGAVPESLDVYVLVGGRERERESGSFRASKSLPSDTLLPVRPHLLTLS